MKRDRLEVIRDMRVAAAIGFGLFLVGAGLTWAADWPRVGAIVMIAGGFGLLALILLSASRNVSGRGDDLESFEPVEDQHERLPTGWPRR